MQTVIHTNTGSVQSIEGTQTTAGDNAKLVTVSSPPSIAEAGTLIAAET